MSLSHSEYLESKQWRDRHKTFLKLSGGYCALNPFKKIGRHNRHYYPYNIHHTHYWEGYQGKEKYGIDLLALSPGSHWFIHRVLGGATRARNQKHKFPNFQQRLIHSWCRLPLNIKRAIIILIGVFMLWEVVSKIS